MSVIISTVHVPQKYIWCKEEFESIPHVRDYKEAKWNVMRDRKAD